jgi:hypothetical protein
LGESVEVVEAYEVDMGARSRMKDLKECGVQCWGTWTQAEPFLLVQDRKIVEFHGT